MKTTIEIETFENMPDPLNRVHKIHMERGDRRMDVHITEQPTPQTLGVYIGMMLERMDADARK